MHGGDITCVPGVRDLVRRPTEMGSWMNMATHTQSDAQLSAVANDMGFVPRLICTISDLYNIHNTGVHMSDCDVGEVIERFMATVQQQWDVDEWIEPTREAEALLHLGRDATSEARAMHVTPAVYHPLGRGDLLASVREPCFNGADLG